MTQTEGAGSVALNGDNQPALPDALVSQSALAIAGNVSRGQDREMYELSLANLIL